MKQYYSELEAYEEMTKYENRTLGEIDLFSSENSKKAYVGYLIEKSIFGYEPNSKSAPDLEDLELEIKSTPVKKVKDRYVSKERLVLNIINYCSESWDVFDKSSFWKKNKNLLIVFYEYFQNRPKIDYKILKSLIYKYPEDDLLIIRSDWEIISNKVRNGKAHEISERDTVYLAACTKGANSFSVQKQPFSPLVAKQRAYSLKSSYMTTVFNDYVICNKKNEKIINNLDYNKRTFNLYNYVNNLFKPYIGKTTSELVNAFDLSSMISSKSLYSLIIKRIMRINGNIEELDEFKKAGIIPKTIRLESNGSIKESMSFPAFKFKDIVEEVWEESEIFNIMSNKQFLFIIFQRISEIGEYRLNEIKFWSMPDEDIEECRLVWEKTKRIILDEVSISNINNIYSNNFPKQKDNRIMHVRPHARNREDTDELPDGRKLTKQCFWLNRKYVKEVIT